jgi:hypothetical protein
MTAVPVIMSGVMYPKGKAAGDKPVPCTFVGNAVIAGLGVGGGPIEPPPDITPLPPLVIWGGPIDPYPDIGFPVPQPPLNPPDPPTVQPPHEGWNWSAAKSGWYYLYVPGEGQAGPKK